MYKKGRLSSRANQRVSLQGITASMDQAIEQMFSYDRVEFAKIILSSLHGKQMGPFM